MNVVWSDRAVARVGEIASFISTHDPEAAVGWTVALFDAVAGLGEFPEQVGRLLEMAHDGGDPGIKDLLSVMARAQLGLPVHPLGDIDVDEAEPTTA